MVNRKITEERREYTLDTAVLEICDAFDAEWDRNPRPSIDDYVKSVEIDRSSLVFELVAIDIERRVDLGDNVSPGDYIERYPELADEGRRFVDLWVVTFEALSHSRECPPVAEAIEMCVPGFMGAVERRISERPLADGVVLYGRCPTCASPMTLVPGRLARRATCPGCNSTHGLRNLVASASVPQAGIPRFQLLRRLGSGSFGDVFEAADAQLDRSVAIKVLKPSLFASEHDQVRFVQEARLAAKLQHPNIATLLDVAEIDGQPCLICEFVDGFTLREIIERRGPKQFSSEEVIVILDRLASALEHAHTSGVIHRDLKPENVLVPVQTGEASAAEFECLRVVDFGLAISLIATKEISSRTRIGGTPAYQSPEQARGQVDQIDARTDVFSLGVISYELLAGRRPLRGTEFISATDDEEIRIPRIDAITPTIPRDLAAVCHKCIELDREDRYANCGELLEDVVRLRAGKRTTAKLRQPQVSRRTAVKVSASVVGIVGIPALISMLLNGEGRHGLSVLPTTEPYWPFILIPSDLNAPVVDDMQREWLMSQLEEEVSDARDKDTVLAPEPELQAVYESYRAIVSRSMELHDWSTSLEWSWRLLKCQEARPLGPWSTRVWDRIGHAEILVRLGRLSAARQALKLALEDHEAVKLQKPDMDQNGFFALTEGSIRHWMGVADLLSGNVNEAVSLLDSAASLYTRAGEEGRPGYHRRLSCCRNDLARAFLVAGRPAEALGQWSSDDRVDPYVLPYPGGAVDYDASSYHRRGGQQFDLELNMAIAHIRIGNHKWARATCARVDEELRRDVPSGNWKDVIDARRSAVAAVAAHVENDTLSAGELCDSSVRKHRELRDNVDSRSQIELLAALNNAAIIHGEGKEGVAGELLREATSIGTELIDAGREDLFDELRIVRRNLDPNGGKEI